MCALDFQESVDWLEDGEGGQMYFMGDDGKDEYYDEGSADHPDCVKLYETLSTSVHYSFENLIDSQEDYGKQRLFS